MRLFLALAAGIASFLVICALLAAIAVAVFIWIFQDVAGYAMAFIGLPVAVGIFLIGFFSSLYFGMYIYGRQTRRLKLESEPDESEADLRYRRSNP